MDQSPPLVDTMHRVEIVVVEAEDADYQQPPWMTSHGWSPPPEDLFQQGRDDEEEEEGSFPHKRSRMAASHKAVVGLEEVTRGGGSRWSALCASMISAPRTDSERCRAPTYSINTASSVGSALTTGVQCAATHCLRRKTTTTDRHGYYQ